MKLLATVVTGALLIGGISVGAEALKKDDNMELKQVNVANPTNEQNGISISEASEIVLEKVENGVIKEAEKDRENGRIIYEIEVKNDEYEYDFKVDAQTGDILKEERDERDGKKRQRVTSEGTNGENSPRISFEEAEEVALNEVNGVIDDIELDRENGKLVYEVEIDTNQGDDDDVTVYVDAVTGKVLYVEWDD
ncbi:PepSY domain-containing protein [Sutcliffiella rhizosphaerae]|uniref:PepSY domain-containing protein n=1 Tax=Sutcliffiella rhizosphaerae TaxID=2880967 RepID=A0ABM8YPY3_9BACI|nr:PepSY domain-containing protein [Sutcliffiella rhizosphaerae]CAG9622066.1 putative protein YkoJ [Sutcliffiella rhizosphaerae]